MAPGDLFRACICGNTCCALSAPAETWRGVWASQARPDRSLVVREVILWAGQKRYKRSRCGTSSRTLNSFWQAECDEWAWHCQHPAVFIAWRWRWLELNRGLVRELRINFYRVAGIVHHHPIRVFHRCSHRCWFCPSFHSNNSASDILSPHLVTNPLLYKPFKLSAPQPSLKHNSKKLIPRALHNQNSHYNGSHFTLHSSPASSPSLLFIFILFLFHPQKTLQQQHLSQPHSHHAHSSSSFIRILQLQRHYHHSARQNR